MNIRSLRFAIAAALAIACPPLFAHPGHGTALADGLLHPLAGLDHLLAAAAIGLWTARQERPVRHALPAAFLLSLVLGVALGAAGLTPAWLEQGLAVSVLCCGVFLLFAVRPAPLSALSLAALTAILHGVAHGAEMTAAASVLPYAAGLVLGTAVPLLAGHALGARTDGNTRFARAAGAAVAACGAMLTLQAF